MKRYTAVILVVLLMLNFAGCKKPADPFEPVNTISDPTSETTATTEDHPVAQLPMVAVSVPVISETHTTENGTDIFRYTYQNISLIVPDPEVADKVILDFLNRTDIQSTADDVLSAAKSAYQSNPQVWTPYLSQIIFEPIRVDQSILSLFGSHTTYSGTPHPETIYASVNYDMLTGDVLLLSDVLSDDTSAEVICKAVTDILSEQKDKMHLYDGFEKTVKDRFAEPLAHDTDWYLDHNGLGLYFAPYDIAPYSSGVIEAVIPYAQLSGILKDAYFPRESDAVTGEIKGIIFEDNPGQYTQVAEIILKKDSDQILLYTDQQVQKLRLITGSWSADGTVFTAENTVFATDNLTPGDAIMVEAELNETLPKLMVQYESRGKTIQEYITLDRSKNAVILTEN